MAIFFCVSAVIEVAWDLFICWYWKFTIISYVDVIIDIAVTEQYSSHLQSLLAYQRV